MADECEEDFLCMGLSSDEDGATAEAEKKVPRDFQSQEDYEKQKAEWKPKVEKGEIHNEINVPIENPTKQEYQLILHAIEQRYFYRKYREGSEFALKALQAQEMADEYRNLISSYQVRCEAKAEKDKASSK